MALAFALDAGIQAGKLGGVLLGRGLGRLLDQRQAFAHLGQFDGLRLVAGLTIGQALFQHGGGARGLVQLVFQVVHGLRCVG